MRIIAGKHRGRVLSSFQGEEIRPTPDRVKESLFQILSSRLVGARVLDLFAGTGALGLEALSRGAKEVVFNDASPDSLALIKKNLFRTGESAKLYNFDYRTCLKSVSLPFDVIFCDPPYKMDICSDVLAFVEKGGALNAGGIVVYESEREEGAPEGWERADFRSYVRVKIALFARKKL